MFVLFKESEVAIIATRTEEDVPTGGSMQHDLEHLATLVVRLVLPISHVDEGEEAIGATETGGELLQVRRVGEDMSRGEGLGQSVQVGIELDNDAPIVDAKIGMMGL